MPAGGEALIHAIQTAVDNDKEGKKNITKN